MEQIYAQPLLVAAALGVVSHLLVFIRLKSVDNVIKLVTFALLLPAAVCTTLNIVYLVPFEQAAIGAYVLSTVYWTSVFVSIAIYRVFFHPLRRYPGPFLARLTQFYHVWQSREFKTHLYVQQLHEKYGDYVRIGPNILSIADLSIVHTVHGQTSKFTKSEWYTAGHSIGLTSMHQLLDHVEHDRRRRHGWDKAFTAQNLRAYDSRVIKHASDLVDQLNRRSGQVTNIEEWIGYFAFDVMGDLAFGRSFEAVSKGQSHWFIDLVRGNGKPMGLFGTTPWISELLLRLPIPEAYNPAVKMIKWSDETFQERVKNPPAEPDIMSSIIDAGPFYEKKELNDGLMVGDARLLIIAGSDTTSSTLTHVMYHLAHEPEVVDKLRKELQEANIPADAPLSAMAHLPYLNGIINESLRLNPAVPNGVYRKAPAGGLEYNGHFIPGGVTVMNPVYTIQRDARAFARPEEFIPERWTTKPDLILQKGAFFPFIVGRYSCIGKQLAYNEMRLVTSRIVQEFDIAFAKGEDGTRLLTESQDQFTLGCAPLELVITSRS